MILISEPWYQSDIDKMVVNKSCWASSALDHMSRLKLSVCVCTEDPATDPVKEWPAESEGSLTVHKAQVCSSAQRFIEPW